MSGTTPPDGPPEGDNRRTCPGSCPRPPATREASVVVNRMRRLPASVGAERIGMVTGASMARLTEAMRGLFEL